MVADNGDAPTPQPPSKPPLPQPSSPSQPTPTPTPTPTQPTPSQPHSGQLSRRRSPRLVECSSSEKAPSKKKARITKTGLGGVESVSFLTGDPVPDDEARRRWPWRYEIEGLKRKGRYPTTKVNSDDDDDELILNVKCHYLQAKILTRVFNIGDCATVKGEEGGHNHVGRILEFFKTNTDEEYFRVQWFFRAEDTVIKDAATSNNKKRVFYSTLMNDNPLDCIVSKVKVLKVAPGINLKSIPKCDYYYDMEYNINYSTFSTIKDDVSSNNGYLSSSDKEEIHNNGSSGASINGTLTRCKSYKSELTLLDLYSGCGGMSTGLCFGAKLSGVDLSTKWAVDANKCACESLRLNHPETQVRNEYAEDFLDLIKEWDKLCKKYKVKEEKTDGHDPMLAGSQDDVTPSKADNIAAKDEYEKAEGHDPLLAGSQDDVTPSKAGNIVAKDEYEKAEGHDPMLAGSQDDVTPSKADNIVAKDGSENTDGCDPMLTESRDDVTTSKADNIVAQDEYEKIDGHDPMLTGSQDDVAPSKADNIVAKIENENTKVHDPMLTGAQDDVTPSKDENENTDGHDPMLTESRDDVTTSKADNIVVQDEYEKIDGHDPMLTGSQDDVTPSKADNIVAKIENEKIDGHDPMLTGAQDDVTPSKDENEKTDGHDLMSARSQDDVKPSKADNIVAKDEYEVEKLVDICYSDIDRNNKRELKFKVRWVGYGPSDDTWEPIQGLRNCQDKIREFVHKGIKAKILPRPGDVDIICGGPPCQGISGHNRHRNFETPLEDERNYQIVVFTEIISFLKPRYVLMENVGDILRFANGCLARYAINCLVREYYQVRLGIMAAGCYGLPQFRLRVFLWGARHDEHLPPFPLPTHDVVFKYGSPTGFERNVVAYDKGKLQNIEKCVLLKDAISDLPPVSNSESRDEMNYTNAPETEFQKFIRATKSDMLGNASLSLCDEKKPLLHDHRPFQLNEDDCLRVSRVPKRKGASFRDLPGIVIGDDNVVSRAPESELMPSGKPWVPNYAINFNDGKNMKSFARVWWDETVSTVLCTPNYRTEAIMHPEQDRVLTIRECARLQGFPDFYALCGTVSERYRQVGNAVAVPVGRALGYTLGMALQKLSGDEPLVTLPPKFAHSTTIDLLQPSLAIEP